MAKCPNSQTLLLVQDRSITKEADKAKGIAKDMRTNKSKRKEEDKHRRITTKETTRYQIKTKMWIPIQINIQIHIGRRNGK